jgi:SAM-dependent methyltransferase
LNILPDKWASSEAYENFMGRWSRQVADGFLDWLAPSPAAHWLDVGCGTGALSHKICQRAAPASILACDPAAAFVAHAQKSLADCAANFQVADADKLPYREGGFDYIVSGLVLNFIPRPLQAVEAMRQRLRPGGTLAAYLWEYAAGMQFLRIFWDVAVALDPSAAHLDEGPRFPICRADGLKELFLQAGLQAVEVRPIEILTHFPDFDAYWLPFLGGTGSGPTYVATLDDERRERLRLGLKQRLVPSADRSIHLTARALAARGLAA